MNMAEHSSTDKHDLNFRSIVGIIFVVAGIVLFIDRYLKTIWLSLAVAPFIGLFLYQWGLRIRHTLMLAVGGMFIGLGAGIAVAFNPISPATTILSQVGYILTFFGLGCGVVVMGTWVYTSQPAWWALVTGGVVGGLGASLLITPFNAFRVVLFLALGTGLPLLIWGASTKLIGLVIPGCLLPTIGGGIFQAWGVPQEANALLSTGIMLVWFAFGWGMITFFSRVLFNKFAWWPLIPGGILAMVGFGLYIGGDPDNALGVIGNTGSIALMIFGLYLLLMRKGIHQ